MMRQSRKRKKQRRPVFLLALVLLTVLMPFPTFAMERDGTVLFFSREDVQALFSTPLRLQLLPQFAWRETDERTEHGYLLDYYSLWKNCIRIDGQLYPGAGRPLWGE